MRLLSDAPLVARRARGGALVACGTLLLTVAGGSGCRDTRAVRLTSHTGDTVVVNQHLPTRIALQIVDAHGVTKPAGDVHWRVRVGTRCRSPPMVRSIAPAGTEPRAGLAARRHGCCA